MYSYSTSLGYPTIYIFLYHIQQLLDVQLQHIAWLPDHIQDVQLQHIAWLPDHIDHTGATDLATLPHTGAIGCTVTAHVQLQHIAWLSDHYRFLYHIHELLDVQLQHIAWLPDHIQTRPCIYFSTTYRTYWMYSYSTSFGYRPYTYFSTTYMYSYSTDPTIYRFLYHIQELLDVQLQHIAWLPDHYRFLYHIRESYWMYSYSTSLGYQTIYRFLYHIQELLDVQLQHIA